MLFEQLLHFAALPLEEHLCGVVLEFVALVLDDGVSEPPHRFGNGLAGGLGASDEVHEPFDAEAFPAGGVQASMTPSE